MPSGAWKSAPKDATIVGLKELEESTDPISNNMIYFAHCYKGQAGAADVLRRFKNGGGTLWDLEFLNDDKGRRVAAFGRAAGIVGMAIGLLAWGYKKLDPSSQNPVPPLTHPFPNYDALAKHVGEVLAKAKEKTGLSPRVIVIGALGRCGGGSCDFAKRLDVDVTKWDLEETKKGGPFPEILDYDIFVNTIYLSTKIPPFITNELLTKPDRKLNVIVDVSCDTSNPNNPIPVYDKTTTLLEPTLRITNGDNPVDVVSIDHLPAVVPFESSKEFGDALFPHLVQYPNSPVWAGAEKLFREKTEQLLG